MQGHGGKEWSDANKLFEGIINRLCESQRLWMEDRLNLCELWEKLIVYKRNTRRSVYNVERAWIFWKCKECKKRIITRYGGWR